MPSSETQRSHAWWGFGPDYKRKMKTNHKVEGGDGMKAMIHWSFKLRYVDAKCPKTHEVYIDFVLVDRLT